MEGMDPVGGKDMEGTDPAGGKDMEGMGRTGGITGRNGEQL